MRVCRNKSLLLFAALAACSGAQTTGSISGGSSAGSVGTTASGTSGTGTSGTGGTSGFACLASTPPATASISETCVGFPSNYPFNGSFAGCLSANPAPA